MTSARRMADRMTKCTGAPWWEEMKMLRVSKREERSRTVLIVEGCLSSDYVQVVETCCDEAISTGATVHLYLRHVSTVDSAGRALLSRLAAKSVHLRASGVYSATGATNCCNCSGVCCVRSGAPGTCASWYPPRF